MVMGKALLPGTEVSPTLMPVSIDAAFSRAAFIISSSIDLLEDEPPSRYLRTDFLVGVKKPGALWSAVCDRAPQPGHCWGSLSNSGARTLGRAATGVEVSEVPCLRCAT